jgi:hypothetical protein
MCVDHAGHGNHPRSVKNLRLCLNVWSNVQNFSILDQNVRSTKVAEAWIHRYHRSISYEGAHLELLAEDLNEIGLSEKGIRTDNPSHMIATHTGRPSDFSPTQSW